ncbi:S1C family serine protease [Mycolicibacterium monacense]|uniref:S1C family serine protease n=1 Tax=Mycolicibacterium monacense TaxID=85693 RepID=UPI0007E9ED72|nr:trypsin-like peptidase domain-containing protein [Mycolicibacterium monacense]OBF56916.1 serine protease [Mycolicibacterium monacense]
MSEHRSLLGALSEEIAALADAVVRSTAVVSGQTRDLDECQGSAWLYDDQHLVTNHHVIEGLVEPIWIRFPDGPEMRATLVGGDKLSDLAVLRAAQHDSAALSLRSRPARLGELCFAFGSPLGRYAESMSFGIVSGLQRSLPTPVGRPIFNVIQTDCAINPGNSGGPLVDIDGLVLGVNTAVERGAEGIGFAVPAETVADVVSEIVLFGSVERASLGVSVMPERVEDGEGVSVPRLVIAAVRSNAAGPFQTGDVILKVGAHHIQEQQDLLRALRRDAVGCRIPVWVARQGEPVAIECVPKRAIFPD